MKFLKKLKFLNKLKFSKKIEIFKKVKRNKIFSVFINMNKI